MAKRMKMWQKPEEEKEFMKVEKIEKNKSMGETIICVVVIVV